ncbi:MAG: hypothetical protein KIT79_01505 [Deltaproteobacteria bacterium]|nr:hypothetical protein [Deltaproteobacteria bacterium]
MATDKSGILMIGGVLTGALATVGLVLVFFGDTGEPAIPVSQPPVSSVKSAPLRPPPDSAGTPTGTAPAASRLPASAPSDYTPATPGDATPGAAPAATSPRPSAPAAASSYQEYNQQRNAYSIEFQEKLNELSHRRAFVTAGLPIDGARLEAVIHMYEDALARMRKGQVNNLSELKRSLHDAEKEYFRGSRDSELVRELEDSR